MILVTGSTGTFGRAVSKELLACNMSIRAARTDTSFDWNKPETFAKALDGIEKVFLISPPNDANFDKKLIPFIAEAQKAGVKFILFSSLYGATPESTFGKSEDIVAQSGIAYTIIRPNFVFQNFINYDLEAIRSGAIYLPTQNSKTAYIDVNDVAIASALILKNPKNHYRKTYTLTGSESLSHQQFAAIFSAVLGKKISNISPSNEEYKATLLSYNLPQDLVDFMGALYAAVEAGDFTSTTDDYELITGQKPTTAQEFVEQNRAIFCESAQG